MSMRQRFATGSTLPAGNATYDPSADALRGLGAYAAPWFDRGAEYLPISVRSRKMVAQSTAEHDWSESIHSIPTPKHGHTAGGLWDHDADVATRAKETVRLEAEKGCRLSRIPRQAPPRYDAELLERFVTQGARMTTAQYETYLLFWRGRLSYGQVAAKTGRTPKQVREAVQHLRRRAANESLTWTKFMKTVAAP